MVERALYLAALFVCQGKIQMGVLKLQRKLDRKNKVLNGTLSIAKLLEKE